MKTRVLTGRKIIRAVEGRKRELEACGVKEIGLFGSFLKGSPRRGSDLDFIVSFSRPSFDSYMDLKFMLQRMFGRRIDLVTDSALKPALGHIKDEALYARI
jgi:predicted nucleotidyltransferase